MIRLSSENDIADIIFLWREAFGDTENEISFFLNNCFKPENTLVYELNSEIASMLFLLEGSMCVDDVNYPSYYLYAACTLNKYRGRGLMAELLSFAKSVAAKRKKFFICLRPGEKSLFDFYEKHGYKTVFYIRKAGYRICDLINNHNPQDFSSKCDREKVRNDAFSIKPYFKWDRHFIDFAFLHNEFYGGNFVENCKGYTLYSELDSTIAVKETTFTDAFSVLNSFEKSLLNKNEKLTVNYPPYDFIDGELTTFAMICAVDESAEKSLDKIDFAYLGLTLE